MTTDDDPQTDPTGSSDPSTMETNINDTAPDPDEADDPAAEPGEEKAGVSNVRRYLNYALLGVLVLLALIAGLRFYLEASRAISQWVTPEYRSLFQAAFNLVVLLVAGIGISRQVKRLS